MSRSAPFACTQFHALHNFFDKALRRDGGLAECEDLPRALSQDVVWRVYGEQRQLLVEWPVSVHITIDESLAKTYRRRYRMSVLNTIEEFEDELDALVETNPDDAGLIDALIEELGADHDLLGTPTK
jgi:hypothetical protein